MNLRSVGALLAISTVLACATATYDDAVPESPGPGAGAGADNGGGSGLVEEGGAPAGGAPAGGAAPQAGAPGTAGKGSAGSGSGGKTGSAGSGSGGKTGGAGSGTGGKTGSGGTVGVAGAPSMGGKAGTGSSGGGGDSAGGAVGTAGAPSTGPCSNPKDIAATASNTGPVGTMAAACYRTKSPFTAVVCSSFQGRTLKINDVTVKVNDTDGTCVTPTAVAPAIDGWNYFDIGAGMYTYAQLGWFSTK